MTREEQDINIDMNARDAAFTRGMTTMRGKLLSAFITGAAVLAISMSTASSAQDERELVEMHKRGEIEPLPIRFQANKEAV